MNSYSFIDMFFFGFAVYSFFFVIFKKFDFYKKSKALQIIDKSAIMVVSMAGLTYATIWIFDIVSVLFGANHNDKETFIRRATGIYALGYWLQPCLYVLATQAVRIKKIANHGFLRFFFAFYCS